MRLAIKLLGLVIALTITISVFAPTRADAHGIGGLEPSDTTADVISVKPATQAFEIEAIENGSRVRLTRTGTDAVYVLGVDSELYLRIDDDGTFVNRKSATRLINKSTSTSKTNEELAREYENTSDDPQAKPDWEKISDSQSYAWHDHRTHYMGDVPDGVTSLGTNELPLRVGDKTFTATFEFRTMKTSLVALPFIVLGVYFLAILLCVIFARDKFFKVMSRKLVFTLLCTLALFESIHLVSYFNFSQNTFVSDTTSNVYGITFIVLTLSCIYKIIRTRTHQWEQVLRSHAPLITVTGFVGLTAGMLIEYRALIEPYPASSLPSALVRMGIVIVGMASCAIFAIGVIHIKQERISAHQ